MPAAEGGGETNAPGQCPILPAVVLAGDGVRPADEVFSTIGGVNCVLWKLWVDLFLLRHTGLHGLSGGWGPLLSMFYVPRKNWVIWGYCVSAYFVVGARVVTRI